MTATLAAPPGRGAPGRPAGGPPGGPAGHRRPVGHTATVATATRAWLAACLAAVALHPLFSGGSWFAVALAAATAVSAPWWFADRLPGGRRTATLVSLVLALLVLAATVAPGGLPGRLFPGSATPGDLGAGLRQAQQAVRTLRAPVPVLPGLALLVAAGVGLTTLLTQLAAAARRPLWGLVPLGALVAVPSLVAPSGIGVPSFVAVAAALLLVLRLPGRQDAVGAAPGSRGAVAAGAVGVAAVVLTLVVVAVLPLGTLQQVDLRSPSGPSRLTVVPPMVSIEQSLHDPASRDVMTVRTTRPEYLRLTALDTFDGNSFTLVDLHATVADRVSHGGLPAVAPAGVPTTAVSARIAGAADFAEPYLALPYAVSRVSVEGDWRFAQSTSTVFSTRSDTEGLSWAAVSQVADPTAALLRSVPHPGPPEIAQAGLAPDLVLPPLPVALSRLATQLRAGTTTDFDAAVAVQRFFTSGAFHYDINAPVAAGLPGLQSFLLTSRRGYCEQFASGAVVLLRAMGIPARVAVGFTAGTLQSDGTYRVTTNDAHAWPEVWLGAAGWVRFEPTPRADGGVTPPAYTESDAAAPPATAPTPVASPVPAPTAGPSAPATPTPAPRPVHAQSGGGSGSLPGWVGPTFLVLLLGGGLAASPAGAAALRRRRRLAGPDAGQVALGAWEELLDRFALLHGVQPRGAARTPRATARLVGRALPPGALPAQEALARLTADVEAVTYGRAGGDAGRPERVASDYARVMTGLIATAPRGGRLRERLFPVDPQATAQGLRRRIGRWTR